MNQIMRVGRGVVLAVNRPLRPDHYDQLRFEWRRVLPDVPMIALGECRIVEAKDDRPMIFEFTGDITPTFVAEFKLWWESLTSSDTVDGA